MDFQSETVNIFLQKRRSEVKELSQMVKVLSQMVKVLSQMAKVLSQMVKELSQMVKVLSLMLNVLSMEALQLYFNDSNLLNCMKSLKNLLLALLIHKNLIKIKGPENSKEIKHTDFFSFVKLVKIGVIYLFWLRFTLLQFTFGQISQ